jgi:hypothetical protein
MGLAACAAPDGHVPDFARRPYEPFSRAAAVDIALREWRLFGATVVAPDSDGDVAAASAANSAERRQGLWQRVGEYWWLGLDRGERGQRYTGMHDEQGRHFVPERDGAYAWSAAFVSYVMRMSGAGRRFPYAASHAVYIDVAARGGSSILRAEDAALYAPQPGDLVCVARGARHLTFADLPASIFPAHCDIAVARTDSDLAVVGGNVENTVALRHLPLDGDGRLLPLGGRPWLVVLHVLYDDTRLIEDDPPNSPPQG